MSKKTDLAERIETGPAKADALMKLLDGHARQFSRNLTRTDGSLLIHPDKFTRIALTTIRTTPKLKDATPLSLLGALMTCSQLGLEPGGPLGQAYLIPFENRRAGTIEATLIIGYQGFIDLMYRSDRVASISAQAVYEADFFQFEYGTNAHLIHRPQLDARGALIGAYGIAELVSGARPFDVLSKSAIDARRAMSKTGTADSSPWNKHYEAMARKTAIRQLFKWLPSSVEGQAALSADGATFKDIPERIEDVGDVIDVDAEWEEIDEPAPDEPEDPSDTSDSAPGNE